MTLYDPGYVNVAIQNWPGTTWSAIAPIVVAIAAVVVSLYSASLSRKTQINSSRPFARVTNFSVQDTQGQWVAMNNVITLIVFNAPALIIEQKVTFEIDGVEQSSHVDRNMVRFPDATQSTWGLGQQPFFTMMQNAQGKKLTRKVHLEYSSLSGGEKYCYDDEHDFNFIDNFWQSIKESAN